ncbi:Transcriptional regulator, LuxR family protein [Labilithrix luteola]|uniref:Transcriptional regulator, LuxR family protein n=1 Tax=Labilithrix luteola TaxID=1391654 RepID=A0A0K1PQI8_9BACT|nr:helix-turn-helix transcriptional regulator [Labilithrix luteola]AKU95379.1 Transcriptional regulator, LuxR family protein [Labilithrix luteola]
MGEDGSIRWHRVRSAVRLIGEVREIGVRTEEARQHLLQSLLREIGATVGGIVNDHAYRRGGKGGVRGATLAGFDDATVSVFTIHDSLGSDINPYHRALMDRVASMTPDELKHEPVISSNLGDVLSPRDWYNSFWVAECAQPARLDHFLSAVHIVGRYTTEGSGLMREAGDRPFTDEDRNVLRLVIGESGGLFPTQQAPSLPPRVQATMKCLLTGASDKEIAQRMRISPHTVRQYVKVIFRTYGVSSRSQLIAREVKRTPAQSARTVGGLSDQRRSPAA